MEDAYEYVNQAIHELPLQLKYWTYTFWLAFANVVAFGVNPSKLKVQRDVLRAHLVIFLCFHASTV